MTLAAPKMSASFGNCPRLSAHAVAVGGRILASIRGALGTVVLAGRHGLLVCSCSLSDEPTASVAAVWTYDRVVRLSAQQTGTLRTIGLTIRGRSDALPLIALDPNDMAAALIAIDRVQHLIDADHAARRYDDEATVSPAPLILGVVAAER
jgi:hypothetical protein